MIPLSGLKIHCTHDYRKNRRDGVTVSSRVMAMSELVGRKLFESATSPNPIEDSNVSTRQMRRKDITTESKL